MGSAVFVGIFCTKIIGVSILGMAPSPIFTLYYFRMYMIMILVCAFYGLCVTPAILMVFGADHLEKNPIIIHKSTLANERNSPQNYLANERNSPQNYNYPKAEYDNSD